MEENISFYAFIKDIIRRNKLTQRKVFVEAGIPEKYGYKLLSGEKRTRQRDVILRICYAAKLTLAETQLALRIYEHPELHDINKRDSLIMNVFIERPGSINVFNAILVRNGKDPLKECGLQSLDE